jgi:hypothetical protein
VGPGVGDHTGGFIGDLHQGEVGVGLDIVTLGGSRVQPGELRARQAVGAAWGSVVALSDLIEGAQAGSGLPPPVYTSIWSLPSL